MTIAHICVLIAVILPLVWANLAKRPLFKDKNYDNNAPRLQMQNLEGVAQRANWAQQNSLEALPGFAAAVIIAHQTGASQIIVDALAVIFIVCRIGYGYFYMKDMAAIRSLSWVIAFFSMLGIFIAAF